MDKPEEDYDISDSEEGARQSSTPASRASSVTPEDSIPCDSDMEPEQNESDTENVIVSKPAGPKYKTYEEADKKCGLILCDFPTVSILLLNFNSLFLKFYKDLNIPLTISLV